MFSVVDFPQPEGPSSPTSMPSGISKVKSSTAVTSPWAFLPRAGNRLVRFSSVIFIENSISLDAHRAATGACPGRAAKFTETIIPDFSPHHKLNAKAAPHIPQEKRDTPQGHPVSILTEFYRVSAAQTIPGVGERSRSGCSAVLRLTSPSRAAAFSSWPRPKVPRARR